jgi:uncharacterized protein YbjQ (UPF0145 family)
MIIATTETIAGHRTVTTLGQVFGVVVRSRGIGGNISRRPAFDRGRRDP